MCNVLYFVTGGMWAYYVYLCWGDKLFAEGSMPAAADMWEQIKVDTAALHAHNKYADGRTLADGKALAGCCAVQVCCSVFIALCETCCAMAMHNPGLTCI